MSRGRKLQNDGQLLLLSGIMSSRENFEARNSLRNTWIQALNSTNEKYYFVVGKKFCPVPPPDRNSEYSCVASNIKLPSDLTLKTRFESSVISEDQNRKLVNEISVDFYHDLIINRLCVLSDVILMQTKINLIDRSSGESVLSATFMNSDIPSGVLVCKSVASFVFPRNFEATLSVSGINTSVKNCSVVINDKTGLLGYQNIRSWSSVHQVCMPASIIYSPEDLVHLQNFLSLKSARYDSWLKEQKFRDALLLKESERYQDILFVDVVDVYRNLPHKLLHFYAWSVQHTIFKFLLKTDDDTFLNVKLIRDELEKESNVTNWWWSSFREGWPVQKAGKWRDDSYVSLTYPPFPCGAGYVLSADTITYLASTAHYLHCFQGEDVSMGIWLAPINPYLRSDCWQCAPDSRGSFVSVCNKPELSVDQMYEQWKLYNEDRE